MRWSHFCAVAAGVTLLAHGSVRAETGAAKLARALVHATSRTTWIYPGPRFSAQPLGYLRAGHALAVRDDTTQPGGGCSRGWVRVEPHGFICLDGGSLGAESRYSRALKETLRSASPLDFEFGWSSGASAFRRVPSPAEVGREQPFSAPANARDPHLGLLDDGWRARAGARPWFLRGDGSARAPEERELVRERVARGSLIAYTRRFLAGGRDWLLRTDGSLVAAERVRPFRRSSFHGVELDGARALPLAWLRERDGARFVLEAGRMRALPEVWPRRAAVSLDARQRGLNVAGQRYLLARETTRDGAPLYLRANDATVVEELRSLPIDPGPRGKWIHFSISKGVLVAYEGRRAVFTTLASPGLGGVPAAGADPVRHSTTPLGTFRINVKHLADDMGPAPSAGESPSFAEVPYAQYFEMPFAIHVAYWHENFGKPMSGGCINVSPLDGKYLFDWTLPRLPPGWDAVVAGGEHGAGTLVHVTP